MVKYKTNKIKRFLMSDNFFDEIKKTVNVKSKRAGFSISKDILDEFNKIAKSKNYNKSKLVENFMRKFVEMEKSLV